LANPVSPCGFKQSAEPGDVRGGDVGQRGFAGNGREVRDRVAARKYGVENAVVEAVTDYALADGGFVA